MTDTHAGRRTARKPPIVLETALTDWGPKGTALGTLNGETVQIDRGIPGERVVAEVQRGRRPRRGFVRDVLVSSSARVEAPCPHYHERCGGCQWQHVHYEAQLDWKRRLTNREMERAGVAARVSVAHAMNEPWRYRRTAAIALGWEAGFRPRGRRGIVPIDDCPIGHPLIGRLAGRLNRILRAGSLPNYHAKVWLDCTVAGLPHDPALLVLIQGIEGLTLEEHPELPDVAGVLMGLDGVTSVAYRHRDGYAVPLAGNLIAPMQISGRSMCVPVGAFVQTNVVMLERLMARMDHVLADTSIRWAADVYGGIGTFGLPLALRVERVALIELDPQAVRAAKMTAQSWGLTNVDFIDRHAELALPEIRDLDLVVVDPPRSGPDQRVVDALIQGQARTVLYVSCSPASLARDLRMFEATGFQIESLETFDFYPQTYHVESLAVIRR